MENLREVRLSLLSTYAQDVVLQAWSPGTKKSYNVYLKLWGEYCTTNRIDMKNVTVNDGIEFLAFLFYERNLGYSAVNTARSALSQIIKTDNSLTFGKQDLVSKFLKGVFRLRPSLPKYSITYDPDIVLKYLSKQTDMDLKQLTFKLTTLLCLLTGQRNQTINSLDTDYMKVDEDGDRIIFLIPKILKTTTASSHLAPLELRRYHDETLCVVTHILLYIDVTAEVRKKQHTQLLISYESPHAPVSTKTTARWVKQTLADAGVDTTVFKAHSTRSSSTSAVHSKGLSMADIRKAAGWKPGSTFAKYYKRPIIRNFGDTLLNV